LTVPEIWDVDCANRLKLIPKHKTTCAANIMEIRFIRLLFSSTKSLNTSARQLFELYRGAQTLSITFWP